MAGYTRNDTGNNIADGNVINASDLDGEFDSIQTAFNETSGHTHDGTVGEGAPISVVGPAQDINVTITEVVPKTTNTMSLGTAALQFKDLYIDGTANIDSLVADTADINDGTIDNTVIGGATPEAATFTTLTATDAVSLDDAVTINDSAADVDFRVEGVGKPNALFVQGSDGNVGVNTNSPTTTLDVNGTVKATVLNVAGSSSLDGAVVVNETGADVDFRVESDTNANALFVQGSNGAVGIGTSSPLSQLEVSDTDGATGINVTAYRNLTAYGNSYVQFNGPRFDTADQDAVIGRGAITLLGNAADTSSSMWISASTASLAPATATEANMQGYQAGLNITSDGELGFWDSGTERFTITSAGNVGINKASPASTLDVSGTVTATGLDLNGNADFAGNLNLSQASSSTLKRTDNTGVVVLQAGADALSSALVMYGNAHASLPSWVVLEGDTMVLRSVDNTDFVRFIDGTGTIFNETSADLDFRIESDTNTHAFFLRGDNGRVGIGTSSPQALLDVTGASGNQLVVATDANAPNTEAGILFKHHTTVSNFDGGGIRSIRNATNNDFSLALDVGVNGVSTQAMFISGTDATGGNVGIGTSSPSARLEVADTDGASGIEVSAYRNGTTYGNSYIKFNGPRSNTTDGNTLDGRGAITLLGNSSSNAGSLWINAASATLLPDTADEATMQGYQAGLNLNSDGSLAFWDSGSQRFLINASGNVGIGTSNPAANLEIDAGSATGTQLQITTTGSGHNFNMVDASATARIRNVSGSLRLYADEGNEAADSHIAFLVDNSEEMRITSDGYVGIGTDSPEAPLTITPGSTDPTSIGGREINYGVNVAVTSGRTGYLCRVINSFTGDNPNAGFQWIYPFDTGGNANNKVFRSSTGATLVDKFWVNQAGGGYFASGVYLGGTAAANNLDEYEEGTWTPEYAGTTGAGSFTYDIQEGYYTKIGNVVTVTGRLRTDAASGATGNAYIGGLPFTPKNVTNTGSNGCGSIGQTGDFNTEYPVGVYAADNQARLLITTQPSVNGTINVMEAANGFLNAANANGMFFSCTYVTG